MDQITETVTDNVPDLALSVTESDAPEPSARVEAQFINLSRIPGMHDEVEIPRSWLTIRRFLIRQEYLQFDDFIKSGEARRITHFLLLGQLGIGASVLSGNVIF